MTIRDAVAKYLFRGFRPMPMWGVDASGRCLCGGVDPRTRKPCNAGKHSKDEDSWKNGRVYGPQDFTDQDNIALALGPWSMTEWLVCLDFDGIGDAYTADYHLGGIHTLPRTLEQRSPRGVHLFFRVPAWEPLGNWTDAFQTKFTEGWALDVRYARGRINAAPSRSAFGQYRWVDESAPVAPLPREFISRLYADRRRRGLEVQPRWTREGKRP